MTAALDALLTEIRACTLCAAHLPLGPRPVLRAKASARLMIVGQAPGTKVHESGIPWNDPSGDRLRDWMALRREVFYDDARIAIVPMGFCYPGRAKNGGDNPPRPECAPTWHERVLAHLPDLDLIVLAGAYAQRHYLGPHSRLGQEESLVRDRTAAALARSRRRAGRLAPIEVGGGRGIRTPGTDLLRTMV